MAPDRDIERLMHHIQTKVDLPGIAQEPTRYWASLPLCVIDAVWSIQANYDTQVLPLIDRFCRSNDPNWDGEDHPRRSDARPTIRDFLDIVDHRLAHGETYETFFNNRQRTSSQSGILKAEAVHRFAMALWDSGINRYSDVKSARKLSDAESRIVSIPGQRSGLTFTYFLMLAGEINYVKGDTHIRRFVSDALSVDRHHLVTQDQAATLLTEAATRLAINYPGLTPTKLDAAIWNYQRTPTSVTDSAAGANSHTTRSAGVPHVDSRASAQGRRSRVRADEPWPLHEENSGVTKRTYTMRNGGMMTYEEVKGLYGQSAKASTWPSQHPRIMCFWKKDHKDLPESDKYIKVPFKDVAPHMERTGYTESSDVFYKLRQR